LGLSITPHAGREGFSPKELYPSLVPRRQFENQMTGRSEVRSFAET
jgi:hypothetical protein